MATVKMSQTFPLSANGVQENGRPGVQSEGGISNRHQPGTRAPLLRVALVQLLYSVLEERRWKAVKEIVARVGCGGLNEHEPDDWVA